MAKKALEGILAYACNSQVELNPEPCDVGISCLASLLLAKHMTGDRDFSLHI